LWATKWRTNLSNEEWLDSLPNSGAMVQVYQLWQILRSSVCDDLAGEDYIPPFEVGGEG
jgi:hypothetical protein